VWVTGVYDPKPAEFLAETVPGRIFLALSLVSAMLFLAELAWRALLVYRYRPIAGCEDELLPDCTVVVPAFNEGKQVFLTLRSLAASDYPEERLELIAVDDGSVDDTWEWMKRAKEVLGDRVTILRQPRNTGKRHALHAGFRRSRGEVLVTVDSDSVVDADTLRNLVAPFVKDRMVGAVAGNLRVLNRDQGIIPRMLDVVFVYTSSYLRASQSMVKAVLCTPGALSAYRRSVVMGVMQEWLHQTFCGQPANIGEDRALTNLVLREGYHVLFQQNAWVHTEVPVTYANLCKMYLRWARGDLRETIALTRFAFKPFRDGSLLGVRINLISSWLTITCFQAALAVSLGLVILHPVTLGPGAFFGVVVSSTLAAAMYAWKFGSLSALWAFFYGAYSFVSLSWIGLYALMTPQKSGWLTRQLPSAPAVDRTGPLSAGSKMFLHEVNTAD
jgi:hyaluronan synthase